MKWNSNVQKSWLCRNGDREIKIIGAYHCNKGF